MKIAVCEDQPFMCASIKELCHECLRDKHIDCEVNAFYNGAELLSSKEKFDILFLDIEMPGLNGFQVARELKSRGENPYIIFLTAHAEEIHNAFKAKAFRYMIKPVNVSEFNENLSEAIEELLSSSVVIVDNNKRETIVSENNIVYIESIGDFTVLHTRKQGDLTSKKTLKYWLDALNGMIFFQTHKSFIVSLRYVECFDKSTLRTTNGKELPLSKRSVQNFKVRMADYIRNT
jgi:two-component system LytT family response regulator